MEQRGAQEACQMNASTDAIQHIKRLRQQRPRSLFLRISFAVAMIVIAACWIIGPRDPDRQAGVISSFEGFRFSEVLSGENLKAMGADVGVFVSEKARPFPLRGEAWSWAVAWKWAKDQWNSKGAKATGQTLAISVVAIVLAGFFGFLLALPAARNLATAQPFLPATQPPTLKQRWLWGSMVGVTRGLQIVLRAIPEYVLAFLLLTLLGPTAWPAVVALALHNAGILGKLGAEVIENTDSTVPRAMRALGASRKQITVVGLVPQLLPRFLLFFFYRWETCVREATVLGMLGFATLGALIAESRVRVGYEDELLFYALLGAILILIGDLVSAIARRLVRRAA